WPLPPPAGCAGLGSDALPACSPSDSGSRIARLTAAAYPSSDTSSPPAPSLWASPPLVLHPLDCHWRWPGSRTQSLAAVWAEDRDQHPQRQDRRDHQQAVAEELVQA